MAAAFFLRVGVAVSSDWIYRIDETLEYLEQAHRLVFGYGIVPWEYRYGTRNWLAVMPAATTLKLFQLMGLGHPDYYVPAVKILNATLSMAVPAGLYFFLRRHLSEIAARAGFVFCCFWWEFLIFAPHTLPSQYGGVLIAAGLGCMATPGGLFRLFLCGFLLGLAGMLRLQYAPVAGLLGLIYLLSLPPKRMPFFMLGGMAAAMLAGWSDYLFWGGWWHSYFQHVKVLIITNYGAGDSPSPPLSLFLQMFFFSSFGLYAVLFFFGAWQWRKYWPSLFVIVILLLIHAKHTVLHTYYSHFFLSFMMFAVLLGGVTEYLYSAKKNTFIIVGLTTAFISIAGMLNWFPAMVSRFSEQLAVSQTPSFLYQGQMLSITKALSRLPQKQVKAVLWAGGNPLLTGNYYYLHHPVPVYHLYFDFQERHRKIINDSGLPSSKLFSHIVALSNQKFDGFTPIRKFESQGNAQLELSIFKNISGDEIWVPENFVLDKPARLDTYLKKHFQARPSVLLPAREYIP